GGKNMGVSRSMFTSRVLIGEFYRKRRRRVDPSKVPQAPRQLSRKPKFWESLYLQKLMFRRNQLPERGS
ncbi:MAG: hypothetical protein LBQ88_22855, partial [Treponema sp.]|nr:hypothetical protein [Treponema sp.]